MWRHIYAPHGQTFPVLGGYPNCYTRTDINVHFKMKTSGMDYSTYMYFSQPDLTCQKCIIPAYFRLGNQNLFLLKSVSIRTLRVSPSWNGLRENDYCEKISVTCHLYIKLSLSEFPFSPCLFRATYTDLQWSIDRQKEAGLRQRLAMF